ncbi:YTM1 [Candida oxycetoniae]|uniref:Ribosome biogenesis protein YTM1 n=1 Tax=Candida oxycetoniae TaxID=497107 RepID=A0AAI9STD3_9ASCO|nr:YTM1 [Candida oxycetoniae]KAI3402657.1 YTM1 [Candida oxycetoniae]
MSEDKNQIKIKFITNEPEELKVEETPLYVPISLKRYGLSEVVNHLLGNDKQEEEREREAEENKRHVPFNFLINGELLRTSIDQYLVRNGLSSEAFLTIEYTRAILPPSFQASFQGDDWISSIDSINRTSPCVTSSQLNISSPKILSGSYDGIVRTYNLSGKVEKQYVGHSAPVKCVKWISPTRIVSAGNDRQVRLWKTTYEGVTDQNGEGAAGFEQEEDGEEEEAEEGRTLAILEGHKAPVVDLAVNHETKRILSAGYDLDIGFWSTNYKEMTKIEVPQYDSNVVSTSSKKRRKLALQDSTIRRRSPLSFLKGHTEPVEGVIFDAFDSTVGYSVSQDNTIKTWDLVTTKCVDTRTTGFALLSILQLPSVNLIATGSSARHINLHDPRMSAVNNTDVINSKLVGHTNFVVGLAASPHNANIFASSSHDGTVKVWDVRADKSLYTITREDGSNDSKIFDVCWDNEIGIISGGEDKKLQINKGSDISK